MRILITGSRTWTDFDTIADALDVAIGDTTDTEITIVHGACPRGADKLAAEYCGLTTTAEWLFRIGKTLTVEPHPADWRNHGRAAGWRRNAEMVNAGADLCLAFVKGNSPGATGCADLAEKAGIRTRRWPQ